MNYRLVGNFLRQRCVLAGKTVLAHCCAAKALALFGTTLALPAWPANPLANSLPTGDKLVFGQAQIGQNGSQLVVRQTSQKAILEWQGFDIGRKAAVRFDQPNANAVMLNRVLAGSASQIHGQLSANGQVWLVNPNGVLFGQRSQVNVGALVASTLDTTNADFMAGRMVFTRGQAAQGGIINQGTITATGAGSALLALLAPRVKNEGIIRAQLGNVVLAAGDKISLQAGADGLLQLALEPSTLRTLIENQQLIISDGGQVLMTAKAADALSASVVANSGTVQARAILEKDGRIVLSADMTHGEVNAAGQLQAPSVATSGAAVHIHPQLDVQSRHWMIQARDVALNAAAPLQTALTSGAVTVTAVGDQSSGGDIHVNADIDYAHQQLTLNAGRSIFINAKLAVGGSGRLELNHGRAAKNPDVVLAKDGYHGSRLSVPGQVDFEQQGGGLLRVNGRDYTVINGLAQLQAMGESAAGLEGAYALGADIDASPTASWNGGLGFAPIGNSAAPFTGVFDGLGHRVSGLIIHRPQQDEVGLFGHVRNALLQNLQLLDGSTLGKEYVGALVGRSRAEDGCASIVNVQASGKVYGSYYVGGLVGHSDAYNGRASISDAHVGGAVQGVHTVGGLVGHNAAYNGDASVCDSGSSAQVQGKEYVGGLVAHNEAYQGQARISNVYVDGKVVGKEYVGAVAGYNDALSGTACIANARWDQGTTGQTNAVGVDTTLP